MAKNKSQLYKAFYLVAGITFVFLIVHNLLAVGLYLKYPDVEPKLTLYKFIQEHLPIGVTGLLVICVLSVIMSSVDSWLNTASSIFTNDIIKPIVKNMSERQELLIARVMTFLIAIVASVVAIYNEKVIELFFSAYNFFYPIVAVPLIAGLIGLNVKKSSFVVGVILGIAATIFTGLINKQFRD
jgi:SSS family solute:Na+ symporter